MRYSTATVTQALVLVGGKASRLKSSGINVASSKAFIDIAGQPLLRWSLLLLHMAGIRRLVIAADKAFLLHKADRVIKSLPVKFETVHYFQDEGNGVHGVPYELRYLLDETYLFDCGHGISKPEHYSNLMNSKMDADAVFSAYTAHPENLRQPVTLRNGRVRQGADGMRSAIAHPIVADQSYAASLLYLKFNIQAIITHYSNIGTLRYVRNDLPAECDIADELQAATSIYEQYFAKLAII